MKPDQETAHETAHEIAHEIAQKNTQKNARLWRSWLTSPWRNPVVIKEIRTRMRARRTFILLSADLIVLAIAVAGAYLVFRSTLTSTGNLEERRIFGKSIFGLLVWIELVMVSFVAPALTSGAIASERERQTLDLLRVTLLPPSQLVFGKYLPGLGFLFLLLLSSIPMQGPANLIGGVLWQEILLAFLLLMITAIAFTALGLLLSSLVRRTMVAATLSYAATTFLVFGIPIIALIFLFLFGTAFADDLGQIPARVEAAMILFGWILICVTPLGAMIGTEVIFLDQHNLLLAHIPLSDGATLLLPSPWIIYTLVYLLFSLVALWLSILWLSHASD